jgi:hypothetical protein
MSSRSMKCRFFFILIRCSRAGLPLAPSLERVACNPSTNPGRRTDDRNSLLHLDYPAGLLVGRRVRSTDIKSMERQTVRLKRLRIGRKIKGAMTTISGLREGKSIEGKNGEQWAKNGEKLPIVRRRKMEMLRITMSVSGEGATKYFERCAGDVEILRFRARAMGR